MIGNVHHAYMYILDLFCYLIICFRHIRFINDQVLYEYLIHSCSSKYFRYLLI